MIILYKSCNILNALNLIINRQWRIANLRAFATDGAEGQEEDRIIGGKDRIAWQKFNTKRRRKRGHRYRGNL